MRACGTVNLVPCREDLRSAPAAEDDDCDSRVQRSDTSGVQLRVQHVNCISSGVTLMSATTAMASEFGKCLDQPDNLQSAAVALTPVERSRVCIVQHSRAPESQRRRTLIKNLTGSFAHVTLEAAFELGQSSSSCFAERR